jgi:repressor of nif and glnA expression
VDGGAADFAAGGITAGVATIGATVLEDGGSTGGTTVGVAVGSVLTVGTGKITVGPPCVVTGTVCAVTLIGVLGTGGLNTACGANGGFVVGFVWI